MNRDSPRSSNVANEHDMRSQSKMSAEELLSTEKEESKSQLQKPMAQTISELCISLTSAQAYSIMKNIPKQFRLIEKTNVKKTVPKEK
jgi:hypothetical protein